MVSEFKTDYVSPCSHACMSLWNIKNLWNIRKIKNLTIVESYAYLTKNGCFVTILILIFNILPYWDNSEIIP